MAALSGGLRAHFSLEAGHVAALAIQSSDFFLEALLALLALGAVVAPFNLRWSKSETRAALEICSARLIVADVPGTQLLQPDLGCPILLSTEDSTSVSELRLSTEWLISRNLGSHYQLKSPPSGAACICFTSGSTAKPKGVLLSHTAFYVQALAKLLAVGYKRTDVYLHCASLFHIGGLTSTLAMLMVGAQQIFQPKFSAAASYSLIRRHQVRKCTCIHTCMAGTASVPSWVFLSAQFSRSGCAALIHLHSQPNGVMCRGELPISLQCCWCQSAWLDGVRVLGSMRPSNCGYHSPRPHFNGVLWYLFHGWTLPLPSVPH